MEGVESSKSGDACETSPPRGMMDADNRTRHPPELKMTDSFVPETQCLSNSQDVTMSVTGNGVEENLGAQPKGRDNLGNNNSVVNGFLWNSREAGNSAFRRNLKELLAEVRPAIVAIVEPRISGVKAKRVVRRFKIGKFYIVDPVGFAGGILLCWDDSAVNIEVIYSEPQCIHAMVKDGTGREFLLSVVYASPIFEVRKQLFRRLEEFADLVTIPWIMLGDFF